MAGTGGAGRGVVVIGLTGCRDRSESLMPGGSTGCCLLRACVATLCACFAGTVLGALSGARCADEQGEVEKLGHIAGPWRG